MESYVGMPVLVFVALVWVRYFDTLEPCPSCSRPSNLYLDEVWLSFFGFNMAYRKMENCYSLTLLMGSTARFYLAQLLAPRLQQVLSSPLSCETNIKLVVHHSHIVCSLLAPNCEDKLKGFFEGGWLPRFPDSPRQSHALCIHST